MQDKEIEQAYKEAQRAENMVKYKDEILSRPKNEWFKTIKQAAELRKESKNDLGNVGTKFDASLTEMTKTQKAIAKKREKKAAEKLEAA